MLRRRESSTATSCRTKLHQLLRAAEKLQQQADDGRDLSTSEIRFAERVAREFLEKVVAQGVQPVEEIDELLSQPSLDTVKFLALFCLALRRSSPFAVGAGTPSLFASIRESLVMQFSTQRIDQTHWQQTCCEVMGPLLLNTDALSCYARLLAETAKQLEQAAAEALPSQALATASEPSAGSAHVHPPGSAAPRSEGHGAQPHGGQRRPSAPRGQVQGPRAQRVDLNLVESLLHEVLSILTALSTGMQQPPGTTVGSGGSSSSSSSSSSSPASTGTAAELLQESVRAQLQSSWVLEHFARVVLLSCAPALAGLNSQQQQLQNMQTDFFHRLCDMHHFMRLPLADFLRRPWGCSLALIHMARLCTALDGQERYGLPRHDTLVVPAAALSDSASLLRAYEPGPPVVRRGVVAVHLGHACGLLPALLTLEGWIALLAGDLEEPGKAAPAAALPAGAGLPAAGGVTAGAHDGTDVGGGGSEQVQVGDRERMQRAAGEASPRRLPPLNRTVTIDTCLRLAKGMLANWGTAVPGLVVVDMIPTSRRRIYHGGRLPTAMASAVLQYALACARLALLPAVWGRERVPRRRREQLRAWWETYVAAAQHPEALAVAMPQRPTYPTWTDGAPGGLRQPLADSAAALEAGLLPCVTRKVRRMGAGDGGCVPWCPPDSFPGVGSCWPEVVLFGPLGQVGELMSGLGRRLHLAVVQLRAAAVAAVAAAAAEGGALRGGRRVDGLAEVAHEVLNFAWARSKDVMSGVGQLLQGAEGVGVAAGAAVRLSVVATELLPALSLGVRACAELVRLVGLEDGQGRAGGEEEGSVARAARAVLRVVLRCVTGSSLRYATGAMDCVRVLLARCCLEAAGQRQDSICDPAGAAAAASGGGGGSGAAWRQLLLQDVQLMELLGAAAELHHVGQAQEHWHELSGSLAAALRVTAAVFPAEFRAAVQGGDGGAGGSGGSEGAEAGFTRSLSGAVALGALSGSGRGGDEELGVVGRVLSGTDPSPEEAWDAVRRDAMGSLLGVPEATFVELLRNMLPPVEARAAAAQAAAAAPAAAAAAATAATGAATAGG